MGAEDPVGISGSSSKPTETEKARAKPQGSESPTAMETVERKEAPPAAGSRRMDRSARPSP
jgi:hypothetical protein